MYFIQYIYILCAILLRGVSVKNPRLLTIFVGAVLVISVAGAVSPDVVTAECDRELVLVRDVEEDENTAVCTTYVVV